MKNIRLEINTEGCNRESNNDESQMFTYNISTDTDMVYF